MTLEPSPVPLVIDRFAGRWAFLSNFSAATVTLDGETYPTVEHAFQAAKAPATGPGSTTERWDQTSRTMVTWRWRELMRAATSPQKAKHLGRQIPLDRATWEGQKLQVMRQLLWQKFAPGRKHLEWLLETGEAQLIEGNTWGDTFWGVCEGKGENWLGRVLMEIRHARRQAGRAEI